MTEVIFISLKKNQDGEDRYAAVTQFEAADARRCFPCWDEPAVKATFALTVTAPKNRTVHSNMPQVRKCIAQPFLVFTFNLKKSFSRIFLQNSFKPEKYYVGFIQIKFGS